MGSVGEVRSLGAWARLDAFYSGGIAAASADASRLYAPLGSTIVAFDTAAGAEAFRLGDEGEGASAVTALALDPSERSLVVAYANLLLARWDLETRAQTRSWRSAHRGPVLSLCFHRDGHLLASGGADGLCRVWELEAGLCRHSFAGVPGVISAIAFAEDGSRLFIGSGEGELRSAALDGSREQRRLLEPFGCAITSMVVSGAQLTAAGRDGKLRWWANSEGAVKELETGEEGIEWILHPQSLRDFAPAQTEKSQRKPKGPQAVVICAGAEGSLCVWDLGSRRCLSRVAFQSGLCQLIDCPAAQSLLLLSQDQNIFQLSAADLAVKREWVGFNDEVLALTFLWSQGEAPELVAATNSPQLRLYRLADRQCRLLPGHTDTVLSLATLGRSRRFLSASKDNSVRLWEGGLCLRLALGHTNSVTALAVASEKFFLSGSEDATLKLWPLPKTTAEAEAAENLTAWETVVAASKGLTTVALAPNEAVAASGSLESTIRLWRLERSETGKGRRRLVAAGRLSGHTRGIWALAFSPTEQILASASGDCSLKLFSLTELACVKTLEGHQCAVLSLAFVGGGSGLVSADGGGVAKLWSVGRSGLLATYTAHEGKAWALAVAENSDGEGLVATGGADSTIVVWRDESGAVAAEAAAARANAAAEEQSLANLVLQRRFAEALPLALRMERPLAALNIFRSMEASEAALGELSPAEVSRLLRWCLAWNSRRESYETAQLCLAAILAAHPPKALLALPDVKELLEGLIPYTRRHYQRLERLHTASHFLHYAAATSGLI